MPFHRRNKDELDEIFERKLKYFYYRVLQENVQEVEKKDMDCQENRDISDDNIIIKVEVVMDDNDDVDVGEIESVKEPEHSKTNTSQEKKPKLNESYMQFQSEDQKPFHYDSSSWYECTADDLSSEEFTPPKKKTKQTRTDDEKVGNPAFNKIRIKRKKLTKKIRAKGLESLKTDGTILNKREMHPNPCIGKKCGNNCQDIGEERRKTIFENYWSISSQRQRDWLISMTKITQIKRKRSKDSGRRNYSFEYYINNNEGRRRVCQQFILNTLDIKQSFVHYTLTNSSNGSTKDEMRGKTIPANKTDSGNIQNVRNFIQQLPAVPSYYCRKDSTKLYLPAEFRNFRNVYRIYKEEKIKENVGIVSEKVFMQIFKNEFYIGMHVPKKDKCIKCIGYDAEKTEENKKLKEEHLDDRDASQARFKWHREIRKECPEMLCVSFDLQNVLNTPYGDSSLLYYSRKLSIYNECFYENDTREGFCFIWSETDGKRGANEIATILQMYIDIVDSRKTVKHLILYCDSCPGRNKNRTVLAVIHNSLSRCKYIESIQINYLLPGHREMSVDSMHTVIESLVKKLIVWAPSQWATVCQLARKEPHPYQVHFLQYADFKGYDEIADKYFKGDLAGKINKIRIATFKKSRMNKMIVKYSMQNDAIEEKISVIGLSNKIINQQIYKGQIPISEKKFNDLKTLCDTGAIPRLFRNEYLNLPSCSTARDTLNETDIEDETDN